MTENSIHRLLNASGIPWQLPRSVLAERYGTRQHPAYSWDVIELPTAPPILDGLLWPLCIHARPEYTPHLPATYFSSVTSFGEHSRDNLRRTARQLETALGKASIKQQGNIERCVWNDGAAELTLTIWPLDVQQQHGPNPSHALEPRLPTGCYVEIKSGFMPSASASEAAWIKSFAPVARIRAAYCAANEFELEFMRAPFSGSERAAGMVGFSTDRAALIFGKSQLFIVPLADILGFNVQRLLPAKGPGGSWLEVECRTQCPQLLKKTLTVTSAEGADDLNELGQRLAELAGKPFELVPYGSDC